MLYSCTHMVTVGVKRFSLFRNSAVDALRYVVICVFLLTVVNVAACVVSGSRGLSRLLRSELQWLDVTERVKYKLGVHLCRCQQNQRETTARQFPASRFVNVCALPTVVTRYRLST